MHACSDVNYVAQMNYLTFTETVDIQLGEKAQGLRMNSVAESTLKSRRMQCHCYTKASDLFGWEYFPCRVDQACK